MDIRLKTGANNECGNFEKAQTEVECGKKWPYGLNELGKIALMAINKWQNFENAKLNTYLEFERERWS